MRTLLMLGSSLLAGAVQAAELHVAAGQERLIDEPRLQLERLVLEDGATLRLAPGLPRFELRAEQAWIGRDVRLLARGSDASAGRAGAAGSAGKSCANGEAGQPGEAGGAGAAGTDLQITLGLRSFGSLLLDTRGGAGSAGGSGGDGGDGGAADRCAGGAGGTGGRGGEGGAGGRGGTVALRYWSLSEAGYIPVSNHGPGVQILTAGGLGAAGGRGGKGGIAGAGEFSTRGNGIKVYRNGGAPGEAGLTGAPGSSGETGRFLVQPQARP
ncbi:hypothetical protein [Pseudomonas sp. WS 5011]|uniref:hypothetical protein n=1 Tax=Pseudomonas sp. WS 5011 TaxID=2717477 RepID=UPI0014754482|nr:hypothetical protein [Pseudomonas sp. WS 5011]NMY50107.1 hypothetical protein [Pseudomonas sp. WS 5011]